MKDRQEVLWKRLEEELKVLSDVQRSAFAAFIAAVLATINFKEQIAVGFGIACSLLLFFIYLVLIIVRQRKIKRYE